MKNIRGIVIIVSIFVLVAFIGLLSTSCFAQLWSPNPFLFPLVPSFNPYTNFFPPLSPWIIPNLEPILTPYAPSLPALGRFANATVIIILNQTTNPVTAYAPLGTVTLTPSAFLPLPLLLTLPE